MRHDGLRLRPSGEKSRVNMSPACRDGISAAKHLIREEAVRRVPRLFDKSAGAAAGSSERASQRASDRAKMRSAIRHRCEFSADLKIACDAFSVGTRLRCGESVSAQATERAKRRPAGADLANRVDISLSIKTL